MSNTRRKVRVCANLLRITTRSHTHTYPNIWKYCLIHLFLCCTELCAQCMLVFTAHTCMRVYPSATAANISIVSLDERSLSRTLQTQYTHAPATEPMVSGSLLRFNLSVKDVQIKWLLRAISISLYCTSIDRDHHNEFDRIDHKFVCVCNW